MSGRSAPSSCDRFRTPPHTPEHPLTPPHTLVHPRTPPIHRPYTALHPHAPPCAPLQVGPEELVLRKQALLAAMHEHRMVINSYSLHTLAHLPVAPTTRSLSWASVTAPLTTPLPYTPHCTPQVIKLAFRYYALAGISQPGDDPDVLSMVGFSNLCGACKLFEQEHDHNTDRQGPYAQRPQTSSV